MSSDPSEQCPRCGYWLDSDWNYCPECGTKANDNVWEDADYIPKERPSVKDGG